MRQHPISSEGIGNLTTSPGFGFIFRLAIFIVYRYAVNQRVSKPSQIEMCRFAKVKTYLAIAWFRRP
jgi:hypothetical protein